MSNFVVSARKYRPAKFEDVVGQSHITTTLKNALRTNQLAHAFLFCGPRGVGKTTCARILGKVINCLKPTEDWEACNTCQSCISFNENTSFNIFELDAASNNGVDDIRELTNQVRIPPQNARYKVYIIDEVHMLTQAAFNAFLKTLEEPPPYAIFILATTEKHKIIPTILSRCQVFDFHRIGTDDMVKQLKIIATDKQVNATDEALHLIAQKADGGLRDALSLFDKMANFCNGTIVMDEVVEQLNILDYDYHFKLTDAMIAQDTSVVLNTFAIILSKGFEGDNLLLGLAEHFRNLMVCKNPTTIALLDSTETIKQRYINQAQVVPVSFLLSALQIISDTDVLYKSAKNKRLLVEICLMKLCYINVVINNISTLNVNAEDLKKKDNTPISFKPIENNNSKVEEPSINIFEKQGSINLQGIKTEQTTALPIVIPVSVTKIEKNNKTLSSATADPSAIKVTGKSIAALGLIANELTANTVQQTNTTNTTAEETPIITPIELPVVAKQKKPYTPMEKFNYLTSKNEHLIEFAKKLNLEVDF
jgi:DNA polymerase-3 subunit gamma/tau